MTDVKRPNLPLDQVQMHLRLSSNPIHHEALKWLDRMEAALAEYANHDRWYIGSGHEELEVVFDSFDEDKHGYELAEEALK